MGPVNTPLKIRLLLKSVFIILRDLLLTLGSYFLVNLGWFPVSQLNSRLTDCRLNVINSKGPNWTKLIKDYHNLDCYRRGMKALTQCVSNDLQGKSQV
jgi:hypothetical protein